MTITILGQRVRKLRREKDWTQAELANRASMGVNTIARLERGGIQDLKGQAIVRLACALGASMDYLCGSFEYLGKKGGDA
jgi:transcriptional regulator with XRE-family HTH domain